MDVLLVGRLIQADWRPVYLILKEMSTLSILDALTIKLLQFQIKIN